MFILNGKPLSPDVAFTDPATGVQYPANWLRLSTLEEKEAIGITTDTAELAAYITGTEYPVWPSDSPAPVESVAIDGLELAFNGGATGVAII
jgi:hypothetical protein